MVLPLYELYGGGGRPALLFGHANGLAAGWYQTLIAAMDVAVKAGFLDVGLTEPQGLSARPAL